MKFLCDRCKTRYSIGDDRVRGKILKIRCKNCANVITVREGMADAEADGPSASSSGSSGNGAANGARPSKSTTQAPAISAATPATTPAANGKSALGAAFASAMSNPSMKPPAALEEEWYVSLDGDQEGPYSLAEAQRWVAGRASDAELHCWSEGFDDWLPVDKVSHFRGLRKKPAPPAAPPPLPRGSGAGRAPTGMSAAPVEDEPKPLFAATMASIEKGMPAPNTPAPVLTKGLGLPPRATPATGVPKVPANSTTGDRAASLPGGLPVQAKSGGNGAAVKPVTPRAAIPGFDLDNGDSATQIESPPFQDEMRTEAEPVASAKRGTGPSANPMFPGMAAPGPAAWEPASKAPAVPNPTSIEGDDDEDDDLAIGEVSRVVNLADLARGAAKARPRTNPGSQRAPSIVGRATGAAAAISNATGPVSRIDLQTGQEIAPLAPGIDPATLSPLDPNYVPDAAMAPVPPAQTSHRRMYIMLGAAALLLTAVVVVVIVVTQSSESTTIGNLRTGPDYSTERPEDKFRTGQDPNPTGSGAPTGSGSAKTTPKNPYVPPRNPGSNTIVPETQSSLSPEDINLVANNNSGLIAACWRRIDKGAALEQFRDLKRVVVTLTVAKDGTVSAVAVKDHQADPLGTCLNNTMRGWKFPSNKSGSYPIVLVRPS